MGNSDSKQESLTDAVQFGPCGTDPYAYLSFDETDLPRGLKFSMKFLTREEFEFCQRLCDMGQEHLFDEWDEMSAEERLALVRQLLKVEDETNQVGGLKKYLHVAGKLLDESYFNAERTSMPLMNPMVRGWSPSVPAENQTYEIGSEEFMEMEDKGLSELSGVGFCISAVGMSSTLVTGCKSPMPKFQLPMELSTETTYLQNCIEHVLHISRNYAKKKKHLPLCIVTNKETDASIREYLEKHNFFGMEPSYFHILSRQEGIPALDDSECRIALDPNDPTLALLHDRGHGDMHSLLAESGTAQQWLEERGLRWLYMIGQETNGMAFHTLPLLLGVSKERGLLMNTLAVPRKAKDDVLGAICALKNRRSGLYKTASVQSNELDALLQSKGYEHGETNDQNTDLSRFPGSTNQILFNLQEYVAIMKESRGQIPKALCPKSVEVIREEDEDEKHAWGKNRGPSTDDESAHSSKRSRKRKNGKKERRNGKSSTMDELDNDDQDQPLFFEMEPASLESRMEDFVHLLTTSEDLDRVGYTLVTPTELAFSPMEYSVDNYADSSRSTATDLPPYTASTAEAHQYNFGRKMLEAIGCQVEQARPVKHAGDIELSPGPAIVLKPNFGFCMTELKEKFPHPENIKISAKSTLIIRGDDIVVKSLDLDGCLLIDCEDGLSLTVEDKVVRNAGWKIVRDPYAILEDHRMRGFSIVRKNEDTIEKLTKQESSCSIM